MRRVIALVMLVLSGVVLPGAARADASIEASVVSVENKFPDEILFTAEAQSSAADIRFLSLRASVGASELERYGNFEFTPGRKVSAQYSFKTGKSNFLVAGADITYWLQVEDVSGNRFETPKQTIWYEDTRFKWSKMADGAVTVYYYGGAERTASGMLTAARETQQKVGRMLGAEARPFKVMLYNSVPDIIGAQRPELSETRSRELIRAGVMYPGEDVVQVLGFGSLDALDTARHEITHLFVHWTAGNNLPAWLDEGMAVWGQNNPGSDYAGALQQGIRSNSVFLLRGLDSFPGRSEDTILAYGQSYSVVKYLIDTYGPAKMRQLMEAIKARNGVLDGLKEVYGLTLDELDAKWRQSVGVPPRSYESAVPTPITIPTIAPIGAESSPAQSGSGSSNVGESGGLPPYLLVIAAAAVGLLVLVAGAAVFTLARRKA